MALVSQKGSVLIRDKNFEKENENIYFVFNWNNSKGTFKIQLEWQNNCKRKQKGS